MATSRERVNWALMGFEDRINQKWGRLYVPNWVHRLACRVWGHCGMKLPGFSGNYCVLCSKDMD